MPPKMTASEARALQEILEAEFAFYGLISALPQLTAPLKRWTYQRNSGDRRRQVHSRSSGIMPHGPDALVLQALLILYLRTPLQDRWVSCTAAELREVTATLCPGLVLDEQGVQQALRRLVDTTVTVTWKRRQVGQVMRSTELSFGFLTHLEVEGEVNGQGQHPGTVLVQLASKVLLLCQTGSLQEEDLQEAGLTA